MVALQKVCAYIIAERGFDRNCKKAQTKMVALQKVGAYIIAERGFDRLTLGLWVQRASHCTTPLVMGVEVYPRDPESIVLRAP